MNHSHKLVWLHQRMINLRSVALGNETLWWHCQVTGSRSVFFKLVLFSSEFDQTQAIESQWNSCINYHIIRMQSWSSEPSINMFCIWSTKPRLRSECNKKNIAYFCSRHQHHCVTNSYVAAFFLHPNSDRVIIIIPALWFVRRRCLPFSGSIYP